MLSFAPLDGAVGAAYNLVAHLAAALAPVGGAAAAIVAFTLAVRLLLLPLSYAAVRGERRRRALLPKIQQLQRRYRKDPVRLQSELTELYRREGATPFSGCLPVLVQAPFFLVTYRLFTSPVVAGHRNVLLDHDLFGVALGVRLTAASAAANALAVWAVLLAVLAAGCGRAVGRRAAAGSPCCRGCCHTALCSSPRSYRWPPRCIWPPLPPGPRPNTCC